MASNNKTDIEKLEECAYDMDQMQCDDVLVLAAQIEREHASELQALEERYKIYLREAREARDIAIKEASKLRNDVNLAEDLVHNFRRNIAMMLGISCDGMAEDVYDAIKAELDKRLMPPGMEWPRFEDGEKVRFGDRFDHTEGYSNILVDGFEFFDHGGAVYQQNGICEPYCYGERVKRHTPPDTQERIDDDATMPPRQYYASKIGHDVVLKDDEEVFTAVAFDLLSRQRGLDKREMGGK